MALTRAYLEEKAQLVANKLMHYDDTQQTAMQKEGGLKEGVIARDFGISEWDWPQGVGLLGLAGLDDYFGDGRYAPFARDWFARNLQRGLPARNINTTAPMHALLEMPFAGEEPYEALAISWADWLLCGLPKTEEGGFQHVITSFEDRNRTTDNTGEIWVDTLFMAVLFLAKMGVKYNRADWLDASVHQFLLHIKYLYEKRSGLFHHAWSFVDRGNFGEVLWLRGNSWYTLGSLLYIQAMGDALPAGVRRFILDAYHAQAKALLPLQDASGLWHTVLDDPTSYLEVSGSANIASGLLLGIRMGVLDAAHRAPALRAIEAVCKNIAPDGMVEGVSGGTVVGRDAEHYRRIILAPMAYGQALALLSLKEALLATEA